MWKAINIEFYGADSHFCHSVYVTWSRVELWSAHVPARLSNFCCRTHFVRRDIRVERSSDVTSCFQKWRKCLLKKMRQRTFLYDIKSPDYRDQRMRANASEGTGKELKIQRKFYVRSRDVSIVCPRLNPHSEICSSIFSSDVLWFFPLLPYTLVLVSVSCLCPFSMGAVATFVDIAVFPEQCSALKFSLTDWFLSRPNLFIPNKHLKNFIWASSSLCPSLFFSTQASLPNLTL